MVASPDSPSVAAPNWLDSRMLRLQRPRRPWWIMFRLRLHRPTDVAAVDEALARLAAVRPELNVSLSGPDHALRWTPCAEPLRCVVAASEPHLDTDPTPGLAPPICVALDGPRGDILTVAVNHGLTDGRGGLDVVTDLLACHAGADASSRQSVSSAELDAFVARARPTIGPLLPRPGTCRPPTDERLATVVEMRNTPAGIVKTRAHRANVSVSSLLIGAVHAAVASMGWPGRRIVVSAPVDLRRRGGFGSGIGNAVAAVPVGLRVPVHPVDAIAASERSLREALREPQLQRRVRTYRLVARPGAPRTTVSGESPVRLPRVPAFETAVLSNLGRVDVGDPWDQVANIAFAPPAHTTISVGTVTLGADLTITVRARIARVIASELADHVVGLVGDRGA